MNSQKSHETDTILALSCYKYTRNPKGSLSFHCSRHGSCFKVSYQCKSRFKITYMIHFCLFWHICWNGRGFPAICIYLTRSSSIFAFYSSSQFIPDQRRGAAGVYPSTHGAERQETAADSSPVQRRARRPFSPPSGHFDSPINSSKVQVFVGGSRTCLPETACLGSQPESLRL